MDYLSPLDASFLDAEDEDPHASLAIASIAVADGPPPDQAEFAAVIGGRLPQVPRYRQRVRRVPWNLGRPVWVDDAGFDLNFHLRRTALAAPGGDAELAALVGRVMSQRLDRDRPLWEDWVIEGLAGGRWALLSKIHHCMADGVTGNQLYRAFCDTAADTAAPTAADTAAPPPDRRRPAPETDAVDLTLDALGNLARLPFDQLRWVARAIRSPRALGRQARDTARGLAALAEGFTPAAPTFLTGRLGRSRRWAVARVPLADLKAVAAASGATLNDVYLAAVAGAFRRLLAARGEEPVAGSVRTMMPVNLRAAGQDTIDNRIGSMLLQLPVEIADPVGRLTAVRRRIAALRDRDEMRAEAALLAIADREPFAAVAFGVRAALRFPQRAVVTVTTNVPGPREQLYLTGRRVREILPYVPIGDRMRVGVSVFTYGGQASFGVTTDAASVPEAEAFARDIVTEVRALPGVPPGRRRRPSAASRGA
ncbi:wax ester/triacylglycerol synthase family O-acyltransferase [Spirilliplanes yamanashiensis]|uniref:Diacylglycerol O-acyltransferase n=1 Tax=Spirilliplanes yamanashiensis TaxID=42233 RepID=A0A8J4DJC3_9ACTN|nr:wax ester/triacylglycerol synthase family O-acyltransferase [Spirilliplanes yamanashiensis]MDP9817259.1 diacylglycerol O-acyltransferase [Spirilliplanes yamanashiensis]GIJ03088.1 diacylglycerol O-acyltransferase [Spirilliplanes yamanashiensis]